MAKFKKITYYEVFKGAEAGTFTVVGDGVHETGLSKDELIKRYQPASNEARELLGMDPVRRERKDADDQDPTEVIPFGEPTEEAPADPTEPPAP